MKYTVKYGHLKDYSSLSVGQLVRNNDLIGIMGSTGISTGPHLHIDLIEGIRGSLWRLKDIKPSRDHAQQSAYFIDDKLFNSDYEITSFYCDPRYKDRKGNIILHPAYDVVAKDKINKIYWNRSRVGKVLDNGYDDAYGYYVLIGYEA